MAAQQLQQLKRELSLASRILQGEPEDSACGSLAHDMKRWDGVMDEIRHAMVEMTARHDLLQIDHDKLKERMESQAMRPRERKPRSGRMSRPSMAIASTSAAQPLLSGQSQDFTAIDAELSKLNESMLRAMSDS